MNKPVLLENNVHLSDELLNLPKSDFNLIPRQDKIMDAEFKGESTSYGKDVWRRFLRSKITVFSAIIILIITIMAIIGPHLSDFGTNEQHWDFARLTPRIPGLENLGVFDGTGVRTIQAANLPNWEHVLVSIVEEYDHIGRTGITPMMRIRVDEYALAAYRHAHGIEQGNIPDPTYMYFWLGSDSLGRCLFTRLWQGARVSLILGFAVALINLTIGLIIGAMCGYYGGKFDMVMQRVMEVLGNLPFLPMAIVLIMVMGSGLQSLILLFLINGWIGVANNVRIQFYRFKNREYVLASRTMGAKDRRVMFKHILPNAAGTIITFVALSVPFVIFMEATLAYFGLGIEAPNPSIGVLLRNGQENLLEYPFMMLYPGIVIVLLMLAFNLLGNGLRDAFNPALRK